MPTPEQSARIREALQRGHVVMGLLASRQNDLAVDAQPASQLAAACQMVAQDHHAAILCLMEMQLYASSFALGRLLWEAYVRGCWLDECATDAQVRAFANGGQPPSMKLLIAELEKHDRFAGGTLGRTHRDHWDELCSYTHTGVLQARGWISATAIEPNYPDPLVAELVDFATGIAILSGLAVTALGDHATLAVELGDAMKEFGRACAASSASRRERDAYPVQLWQQRRVQALLKVGVPRQFLQSR